MISIGININDKQQAFTEQILGGLKTIETRNKNSLKPYIGRRVGIVRTGKGMATLVGFVTIGEPVFYADKIQFDADHHRHLVAKDSPYYITSGGKWGYPLQDVMRCEEKELPSRGIIARAI